MNGEPWTARGNSMAEQIPIRHLRLKQMLVRFAEWAGWLTQVDRSRIAIFLGYRRG